MDLAWVVVKDFKKAVQFYKEVMGLVLLQVDEQFGWAEFQGKDGGMRLGVSQMCEHSGPAGQNAVVALTVDDIVKAKAELEKKGAKCVGEMQEVPGHVKLQMIVDNDGNQFQLAQLLNV
jgi:predicted enzyme related to lactoylglutathione lyase